MKTNQFELEELSAHSGPTPVKQLIRFWTSAKVIDLAIPNFGSNSPTRGMERLIGK